jgi:chorismate dehydratase
MPGRESSKFFLPPPCEFILGSVPYLNAKPLTFAIEHAVGLRRTPAGLCLALERGEVHAALAPIAFLLDYPEFPIVAGAGIGARGTVRSVIVLLKKPLEKVRSISLDPASRSSSLLARVWLEALLGMEVAYVPRGKPADANLWIGDAALALRRQEARPEAIVDLGEVWKRATGYPFVFAAWILRPEADTGVLPEVLRKAKEVGLQHIAEIATTKEEEDYLKNCIWYELGWEEQAGIQCFFSLLQKLGIAVPAHLTWR